MATTSNTVTDRTAAERPEPVNYLMDEANNLSVIFASLDPTATRAAPLAPPLKDAARTQQLRAWIRDCNSRIATIRERDDVPAVTRTALLGLFPSNLHFPMGALIDFANRLGRFENLELANRIGLETQTIVSGILYLQQFMQKRLDSGLHSSDKPRAYSRQESEATWTCLRELVLHCCRKQRYDITLDSATDTLLPVPTLDIRLIIQNVIFSVLNGSYSADPIAIHVSNMPSRQGQSSFCLAIRVPGNPLSGVLGTALYNAARQNHTFVFEGSGIGHILAAKLLEFLDGEIVISNNLDGTNTVSILIPLDTKLVRAEPESTSALEAAGAASGFSVLYIEDMCSHAQLVKQIFERLSDIDLQLAATGWAGLKHAQEKIPDLILLDMELPDMKGQELYQRLRADPRTATIPVFAISASAMPHQVQEALDMGMRQYITKPFSYKDLIRMLQDEQSAKKRLAAG